MTRDEIMQLDDDALRIVVAKALGYELKRGFMDEACINPKDYWVTPDGRVTSILPDWPRDIAAAIVLLDSMTYQDGVSVEYVITKITLDNIAALDRPYYRIYIFGRNPIDDTDFEADGDTLPTAICRAWLMWKTGA